MAKNRELKPQPPKPVESESETSEEEDDETSSGSDSEPELTANVIKQPLFAPQASSKKTQNLSVPNPPHHEPSEESESESESDSDPDPDPKPTSIATESMSNVLKFGTKNPSSKPPVTPSKPSIVKHNPTEEKTKEGKKSKKKVDPETPVKKVNNDSKKPLFQRIWSMEDEIVILNGMIQYSTKKKGDPLNDVSAFHNFIKKNLDTVDVTDTQLLAKIRRMKSKYQANKSKENKDGKERVFSNAHEKKAYELSKVVWGNGNVIETPKFKNAVVKREYGDDNIETVLPPKRVKYFGGDVEDRILMMGNEMFEQGIGAGAEEWKILKVEEIDAYLRYLDVKARRAKLVMKNLEGGRK